MVVLGTGLRLAAEDLGAGLRLAAEDLRVGRGLEDDKAARRYRYLAHSFNVPVVYHMSIVTTRTDSRPEPTPNYCTVIKCVGGHKKTLQSIFLENFL